MIYSIHMIYKSNIIIKIMLALLPLGFILHGLSSLGDLFLSSTFIPENNYYSWLFLQYNVVINIIMTYSIMQLLSWTMIVIMENIRRYLTGYVSEIWFEIIYKIHYSVFIGSVFIMVQSILFLWLHPISGDIGAYCDYCSTF